MRRWVGRLGAAAAGLVGALAVTGVAYAHTEVEIEPAVAGSTNAVMTVNAAAESNSAGVASIRVVLPAGIPPSSVTLRSGPTGWTLTPTEDGYSVGGPALPVGENAVHAVTIARLPDETRIVIKTLVNYTDGSVDRWIEEPTTANPQPDNPAPVVTLAPNPNPRPTTTTAPATSAPATSAPTSSPNPAALEPADGDNTWVWWVVAAIVLVGSVTAAVLVLRRGTDRT
jgi:uncharacterized protein YcnI